MVLSKPALPKPDFALDVRGHCAACEIRELSVCSALSQTELARLSAIIQGRRVETGGTVISEGDPATDLFNVVRGSVKLYKLLPDGRRQVTGFLFPGDFLGIALNDIYAYTAEALEPLQLCRFPRKKLEDLLVELPKLERRLLGETAHELAVAQDQMLLLGRKTAKERVASFLVSLSRRAVKRRRPASPLEIPMSRTDMADFLGLTTETVSRTLTQLRRAKLIADNGRKGIAILDRDGLSELVDGDSSRD
ncbi:MAG TPA: helix-turn-helix domain-containing protein [Verrucomicrobiae bacterium]|jgi:CRP/FNR family transcriptional regulator, anaerobic regulatory protein|nr:helix-turn-helix domain-containing protein [Verrucomicrobiae bacterium]